MSDTSEQELSGGWDTPAPDHVPGLSTEDRLDWLDIRATIRMLAADEGWSMSETARRADVSPPTFNTWYSGKSRGSIPNATVKLKRFLRADEERRTAATTLVEPGFVRTRTAAEVMTALLYAQQLPGIALVTLGPGMGKTTCLREVLRTRPHTYAITASRSVRTTPAVNREIASRLDLGLNPATIRNRIGERLQRNTKRSLLIVDEAQNLCDEAVDELRHFLDQNSCGIALLGNEDVIGRWGDARPRKGYAQIHRRIDFRLRRLKPLPEDVDAYVAAWKIEDEQVNRLLTTIGKQHGALGQIERTLRLANIFAGANGRAITAEDVKAAWSNRSGGDE